MFRNSVLVVLAMFAFTAVAPSALGQEKAKKKAKGDHGDGFVAEASTSIDFSETMIDGKMQAPQGFFLQGRQAQSLTQMVKLRPNFRSELRDSKAAVRSLVK